jgi:predicted Fe-Mo cluster-binding NifX family protein
MSPPIEKIAFVVEEDGERISAHFGRADTYLVVTLESGVEVGRETRPKFVAHGAHQDHEQHDHGHGAGHHGQMVDPIRDCKLVVARGMGQGAFNHLRQAGIEPLLTDLQTVESALQAYLSGQLIDQPDRLHAHGGHRGHEHED